MLYSFSFTTLQYTKNASIVCTQDKSNFWKNDSSMLLLENFNICGWHFVLIKLKDVNSIYLSAMFW